jgi:hypothetical protein
VAAPAALLLWTVVLTATAGATLPVSVSWNTSTPEQFGIYELTLGLDDAGYANPFQDVSAQVTFHSPTLGDFLVHGFYYDTDTWKVRFNVREQGSWTWDLLVSDGSDTFSSSGGFSAGPATGLARGFVSRHAQNPLRLVWDDGRPCYPVGIQFYGYQSPMIEDGNMGGVVARRYKIYMEHWGKHGATFYRRLLGHEQNGGHAPLWSASTGQDRYDLQIGRDLDAMFQEAYQNGLATILVFFDKDRDWSSNPLNVDNDGPCSSSGEQWTNSQAMAYEREYFDYCMDRFGAYVHVWQFFNEKGGVPSSWFTSMYGYLKGRDPYQHPVNTTWDAGSASYQDINAPHYYDSNTDDTTWDQRVNGVIRGNQHQRPCIVDEFGAGRNNSSNDPFRWRTASWISWMAEGGLVFWHTTYNGANPPWTNANAFFNREATLAMGYFQDAVYLFPASAQALGSPAFSVSDPAVARGYALGDSALGEYAVYLFHNGDLSSLCTRCQFTIQLGSGTHLVRWYDPASGAVLGEELVSGDTRTLTCPPFQEDIYCRITARYAGAPVADAGPLLVLTLGLDAGHTFDGTLSPGAVNYRWRFGDYGGSTAQSPRHDFTRPGLFPVTLTVDDGVIAAHDRTLAGVFGGDSDYLVFDPFEDGELADWFHVSGDFEAVGGRVRSAVSGILAEKNLTAGDFIAQVDVKTPSSTSWGGICFRKDAYKDSHTASGYLAYLQNTGVVALFSANTDSVVASASTGTDPRSGFVTLRVETSGTNIRVSVNGTLYIDWTDDGSAGQPFLDGAFGLQVSGSQPVELDNFSLRLQPSVNQPPVAVLSASPTTADPDTTVVFDASNSQDPDSEGWIVAYVFDFGDGASTITDQPQALHAYSVSGWHTATLTVYDNRLGWSQDTVNVLITGDTPTPLPSSTPAATASPSPSPESSATPSPTPSSTPSPSPTATPSPAPSPTATPSPTPLPTLVITPLPDTPTPTPCPGMRGDVDDDGRITTSDALFCFRIALGLVQPTPGEECRADADQSGFVDTADALCIFQQALGIPNPCFG